MKPVGSIDLDGRTVSAGGSRIAYDYLIVAAGNRTSYFGNDGWEKHAPGLKSLEDARTIRNKVLTAFEKAEAADIDAGETRKLTTMVVVGAGPTGVEMAGSLAELAKRVVRRDFRKVDLAHTRIILVEATDRVLPSYPPELSAKALRQLEGLGVEVRLGQAVADIGEETVLLRSGEKIGAANIIWTAGVRASGLTDPLDVPKDRAGRILVEPDCSIPGHPEAFAVGDLMSLEDRNGVRVPGVAQGAIQSARHVAGIIAGEVAGRPQRSAFAYFNKGDMATIGRKRAVAEVMGWRFSGPLAWFAWLGVHLVFLVGLQNRISVFVNWVYAYVRFQYGARIIWGDPAGGGRHGGKNADEASSAAA
jgi:NADH dehydrogenase